MTFAFESVASGRAATGRIAVRVAASLVIAALAACASKPASERFFALNDGAAVIASPPAPPAGAPPASSLPGVVVSAVTIPELIDRPQIVTRDSANRVIVSEDNLWAESVKSGVGRTLATRIARALGDAGQPAQVAAYPQSSIAQPVLRVTVDIVRFDAEPNGEAVVDALWTIRRPSDESIFTGHSVASAPIAGTSYEAIVGGWNRAVEQIDRDIANAVVRIGVVVAPPKTGR